jgi:nucleoside-diphosphate-sugar epimerase
MRILLTGASGWIGSASATELIAAGHEVVGLVRSDTGAAKVAALGAEVVRGTLEDLDGLRAAARGVDGVVHLGYVHDFSRMDEAARIDRAAIEAFADALAGRGGPLLIASGTLGLARGRVGLERDQPDPAVHPRVANGRYALGLAQRGVRSIVVRFAPTVHGAGDHGFVAMLARIARQRGVSGYLGDGANRWPAVHRLDAAALLRRAIDRAAPGSVLHAVAEEGIATRDIATALGTALGLPTAAVAPERAAEHFGWLGAFFGADVPASSAATRAAMDWTPRQPTLLDDIAAAHYPGD